MNLFNKFQALAATRADLIESGHNPFGVVTERLVSPTEGWINGRRTILAGTNNYLGLTFEPQCIEAAQQALQKYGTGTTGSRMANGTYIEHTELERQLADFFDCPYSIVFSTGYQANLAMLSTLAGPGDVILIDADSHASIYDGCRMSDAEIIRFRHNDVTDLQKRLRRLGERASSTLIVVEGIYSMLGDRAPLADIVRVKNDYGACLLVDEAHSLGVLGKRGRGLAEEANVEHEVDFIVGTFSKSLGSIGGFCVSRLSELELIRYGMRPYVFTASPSPPVIAATRATLNILSSRSDLRDRLWNNARHLYQGLKTLGFTVGPEPSPVVAVMMNSKEEMLTGWHGLLDHGVYVNLVPPAGAPNGACLLRCSVSAAHTSEQIEVILQAFSMLPTKPVYAN